MKPKAKAVFSGSGSGGSDDGGDRLQNDLNVRLVKGRQTRTLSPAKQMLRRVMNALKKSGLRTGSSRLGRARAGAGAGVRGDAGKFGQRVFIRVKPTQLSGATAKAKMAKHLDYIQRDGVGKETEQAQPFGPDGPISRDDVKAFGERCLDDRHQFRMQVSPEFGAEMNLEQHVTDLLGQMERDLGSKLDWVAVCHYNTDNPHAHVVIRGKTDVDTDLVMARDYIKQGVRSRASDLATNELGYRTRHDLFRAQAQEVGLEKFTGLDRAMLTQAARHPNGELDLRNAKGDFAVQRQTLQIRRVHRLKELGLATEVAPGRWHLSTDTEGTLRLMQRSREMAQTLGPHLADEGTARSNVVSKENFKKPIEGRVLDRGYSDEITGREYMVVGGYDGAVHYINLPMGAERVGHEAKVGDSVQILKRETSNFGTADRNIQEVAAASGGIYSADHHTAYLKASTTPEKLAERFARLGPDVTLESYVQAHVNRAASLASHAVLAERPDGYSVPGDFESKVVAHREAMAKASGRDKDLPVQAKVTIRGSAKNMADALGYTKLDKDLQDGVLAALRAVPAPSQSQASYLEALEARTDRLITLGMATKDPDGNVSLGPDLAKALSAHELKSTSDAMTVAHGRYVPLDDVRKFKGEVAGILDLPAGPIAVVRSADTFTLVPADSKLLAANGKQVEVSLPRGRSVADWSPERQRQRVAMVQMDHMDKGKDLGFSK